MRQVVLGASGLRVGRIGQGTFRVGGLFKKDASRDADAVRLIRRGVDLGMNLIDTAENYGAGHCEEVVGQAIRGIRDQVVIAGKFAPEHAAPEALTKAVEASLKRLNIETLDICQVHWPNYEVPWQETFKAMEMLVLQGKVRALGLGNCSSGELKEILRASPHALWASCQNEYSLQERGVEKETLGILKDRQMRLLAYSPLSPGKEFNGTQTGTLQSLAQKYDRSTHQIVLNWLCRRDQVIPIPQTFSERHLAENAQSLDFSLDPEDSDLIDRVFRPRVEDIPTHLIRIADAGERGVYKTLEEAVQNRFGWTPSPMELSRTLRGGDLLKPVKLRRGSDVSGPHLYELVEGRVKYWAWVIAHEGQRPIPAIVENQEISVENE